MLGVGALLTFYLLYAVHAIHTQRDSTCSTIFYGIARNAMNHARGTHAKRYVQGRSDTQVRNHGSRIPRSGSKRISRS